MKIDSRKLRTLMASQGYTNTKLAKVARVSRQTLHAILNKDSAEVRGATVQGLVRALNLADENAILADPLAVYKLLVAEEHAHLDFRGLGLPTAQPRRLDDLFVPIRLRARMKLNREEDCLPASPEESAETEEPSLPTEELLGHLTLGDCLLRRRRLLLRGEPGSGKTTALRHIARSYAEGNQGKDGYPDCPLTPLFIRLADYAKAREQGGDLSVVQCVLTYTQPEASPESAAVLEGLLEEELRGGRCLVLLDGLDEAGCDGNLPATLREFVTRYPDNQFVLSSRVVGLDSAPWDRLDFATCEITRWKEEDIRLFAQRWHTSRQSQGGKRQRQEDERRGEELSDAILNQRPLREIATNPLMLTILAALHHANASLPRRRVDLYAKVVEVLLETWEAGKREARQGDLLHGIILDSREFAWLLGRLALAMQRDDRVLSPRWRVADLIQQFLSDSLALEGERAKDQRDRVIRHLCERSGLLVERGADIFGFSHRTFQEYFAACGILDEASRTRSDALSLLRQYLYHPRWEEVVRHVAAQLAPPQATSLLRILLDDPDPAGRFLRRGLRLALRCLADGALIADRRLIDQLFSTGSILGESRWLGIPLDIIDSLLDLKASRYSADAGRMLADIESAARRTLRPQEYLGLYTAIHGSPEVSDEAAETLGAVHRREFGGLRVSILSLAPRLRREAPGEWYTAVCRLVRSQGTKVPEKLLLIDNLTRDEADKNQQVRGVLEDALTRDRSPAVRSACAWKLERAAVHHSSTAKRLLKVLTEDSSNEVRMSCASALSRVASRETDVRDHLLALLESSEADAVRKAAVGGLSRIAQDDPALFKSFVVRARDREEAPGVRIACLRVIADSLGKDPIVDGCVTQCFENTSALVVQRVAAQIVAEALAGNRWAWSPSLVARAETILMGVPEPCPHMLHALTLLVSAKEVHGGLRLERLLEDALAHMSDRITLAFIFGSVARREQGHDSDIDLLIVGDIRLKELTGTLRTTEQGVGRIINPALYTPSSFKGKYQAGDPFLLEIVRNEKIFLKGDNDELRELVAERLSR